MSGQRTALGIRHRACRAGGRKRLTTSSGGFLVFARRSRPADVGRPSGRGGSQSPRRPSPPSRRRACGTHGAALKAYRRSSRTYVAAIVRLRLMCDTAASLDARHSRNASGVEGGRAEVPGRVAGLGWHLGDRGREAFRCGSPDRPITGCRFPGGAWPILPTSRSPRGVKTWKQSSDPYYAAKKAAGGRSVSLSRAHRQLGSAADLAWPTWRAGRE